MTILSQPDPAADIVCSLPVNEAGGRLQSLQAIVGDRLDRVTRADGRLRVRIGRAGRVDLDAELIDLPRPKRSAVPSSASPSSPNPTR